MSHIERLTKNPAENNHHIRGVIIFEPVKLEGNFVQINPQSIPFSQINGNWRMTVSDWTKRGATLSQKNACKEYGLSEDQILIAVRDGKLQYRQNYAHGNPYLKLLRSEVESLAKALNGVEGAKKQALKNKLQKIDSEIRSLKRKVTALEKEKTELTRKKT